MGTTQEPFEIKMVFSAPGKRDIKITQLEWLALPEPRNAAVARAIQIAEAKKLAYPDRDYQIFVSALQVVVKDPDLPEEGVNLGTSIYIAN